MIKLFGEGTGWFHKDNFQRSLRLLHCKWKGGGGCTTWLKIWLNKKVPKSNSWSNGDKNLKRLTSYHGLQMQ